MTIVSQTVFEWFVTVLTGGLAGTWLIYDLFNLVRFRGEPPDDPIVRDKRFGYLMGIVIGVIGVWGCLRFHDVV
jgi:hypothetical protein